LAGTVILNPIVFLDDVERQDIGNTLGVVPYGFRKIPKPSLKIGADDPCVASDVHGCRDLMNVTEEVFACDQVYS
jgi:hypothetical protein